MEPPITHTASQTSPEAEVSPGRGELSDREVEILRLVATGASNKQIAQLLTISPNTVKVHLRNIFTKIGAASRTEATVYAIQAGLVQISAAPSAPPPAEVLEEEPELEPGEGLPPAEVTLPLPAAPLQPEVPAPPASPARQRLPRYWWVMALPIVLLVGAGLFWGLTRPAPPTAQPTLAATQIPPTPLPRWQTKAPMLTARSSLAVSVFENLIYAIGGQTQAGVTDLVERYDPATDTWTERAAKPVAVTDASAAVVGGKIYVPGGRLAEGVITNTVESYDPRTNQWQPCAPLPTPLSGYAIVAFEGKLYLFGGWDGKAYTASVYAYDPVENAWKTYASMPTRRGFAAATVAGGEIYVIGGTDGKQALAVNERYLPAEEASGRSPWQERRPMPLSTFGMGAASVADIIHVIGGQGDGPAITALEYYPLHDEWQTIVTADLPPRASLGLVALETNLHLLGGLIDKSPSAEQVVYKAIYTTAFPVIGVDK